MFKVRQAIDAYVIRKGGKIQEILQRGVDCGNHKHVQKYAVKAQKEKQK